MAEFLDNLTNDILKKIEISENQNKNEIPFNIDYSLDEEDNEEEKQEKIIDKQDEINQINNDLKISIPNLDSQNIENINQKEIDLINPPTDNYIRESIILNSKIDNQQIKDQGDEFSKNILPVNNNEENNKKEIKPENNDINVLEEKQDTHNNLLIGDDSIKRNSNNKKVLNNLQIIESSKKESININIAKTVEEFLDNIFNDVLNKREIEEKENNENKKNYVKEEKQEKEIQKEQIGGDDVNLKEFISKELNQINIQRELECQNPEKKEDELKEENINIEDIKNPSNELLLKQKSEIPSIENIEEMNNKSQKNTCEENISNLIKLPEEGDNISKKLNLEDKVLEKEEKKIELKENIDININPETKNENEKIFNKDIIPLEKEPKQIIEKEKVSSDKIVDIDKNVFENNESIKEYIDDDNLNDKKEEINNKINETNEIKINPEEIKDSGETNKEIMDNINKDDINNFEYLEKDENEKNEVNKRKIISESGNDIINNTSKAEDVIEKQLKEPQNNNNFTEEEIIRKKEQLEQKEKDDNKLTNIISEEPKIINNQNELNAQNSDNINIIIEDENVNKIIPKYEKIEEINYTVSEEPEKEKLNLIKPSEEDNNISAEIKSEEKIIIQNEDKNNNQEILNQKEIIIEDITPELKSEKDKNLNKEIKPSEKDINQIIKTEEKMNEDKILNNIKHKDNIEILKNISKPENIEQEKNFENKEIQENNVNTEDLDNKNSIEINDLIKNKNNESIEIQINQEESENSDKNINEINEQKKKDNIPINNEDNIINNDSEKIMDINEKVNEKNNEIEITVSNPETNILKDKEKNLEVIHQDENEKKNETKNEFEIEEDKNKEINELDLNKEQNKNSIKSQKKIEIINTYSIDDIEDSENDNHKLIEGKKKPLKSKTYLNKINKPEINIPSAFHSENIEKEKEKSESNECLNNNKYIYTKPKNDNKNNDIEKEKDINKNIENKEQKNLIELNREPLTEDNKVINKNNENNNDLNQKELKINFKKENTVLSNNKNDDNNFVNVEDINEEIITGNDINLNERKNIIEDNNKKSEYIKKFDINVPTVKSKILKLIKIINPLNIYLKKWEENIHSKEIEIPFKKIIKELVENKYNNYDMEDNDNNKKLFDNENITMNNNIFYQNNKNREYKDQKNLFINNVQKRIKLKNKILKFINNQQKDRVFYYFKNWKDKTLSNKETQFNRIITTSINQNKYIMKRKFIPGKKILPFEKLDTKFNQPYKTKTPRPIRNIINKTENNQKIKLIKKLIIQKTEEEKNYPLRKYINIWKQHLQNDKGKNIDKGDGNKLLSKSDEKKDSKAITYKKRKIKEFISNVNNEFEDLNNNQKRIITEKSNNLYIKHKAQIPNFISSMKNIINDINEERKEKNDENIINNNDTFNTKEIIKKFILPMPKKEETKECQLILNPFQRNEVFDEINLNLDVFDIKKTPKIPKIKFKKKTNTNTYKIIHNRNKTTDIELLDKNNNNNRYKIINKNIHSYIENNPENDFNLENNPKTDIEIFHKKIDITTDSEGPNTISLKRDSPIETQDFGYNKTKVRNLIQYKKIIKKVKNVSYYDNERNIEKYDYKTIYNNNSKHIKSKSFISDYEGFKTEENKKLHLGNKLCKKEYVINYNNLILCEEIIYKSNEAVVEKKLNIKPVKKPRKIRKNKNIINSPITNIISKEKQSIFFQKVMRYKKREMQFGYQNINKSPIRLPVNPNDIELQISTLSPFTKSSENLFKKEIKRFEKLDRIIKSPDICITDRGERKENFDIFNSPKVINTLGNNNNIFDVDDSIPIMDNDNDNYNDEYEIEDEDLKNKINDELKLTKKLADFHSGFMNNITEKTFNKIQPSILYNIIKNNNKKLCLLKIFYIYAKYKMNKYLLYKSYFRKWKKAVNFIDIHTKENIHILNKLGHCISAKNVIIKEIRCGIHPNNDDASCFCMKIRTDLRRILLRYYLLKKIDVRKYYLFKWYKNIFRKIRPLYMVH